MLARNQAAGEQVRRCYRLVDQGDMPGLVELFTEDAVYRRPGYDRLTRRVPGCGSRPSDHPASAEDRR
ncbi:hypothetical protein [Micromonospora sp. WMMD737]|uniref:hypothetical protein n=1 Tax=Micromonospora sp. WMMD737 TaxID=3404113 RepID=UPI003B942E09